jgi:hypothetical protein
VHIVILQWSQLWGSQALQYVASGSAMHRKAASGHQGFREVHDLMELYGGRLDPLPVCTAYESSALRRKLGEDVSSGILDDAGIVTRDRLEVRYLCPCFSWVSQGMTCYRVVFPFTKLQLLDRTMARLGGSEGGVSSATQDLECEREAEPVCLGDHAIASLSGAARCVCVCVCVCD